ncbi:MAG: hypothetical protein KatS3mg050_2057 [Litorilinea sp.]|nr:MAG: hypothetical protein KatS3mg050_2057 [Litorilinea sp.]
MTEPMQAPPEHLGTFYLGAEYDLERRQRLNVPINYDARDLTTHAICVGMTGSGKTGLCIDLLEEAGLDRVPALLIDPKGDLTNLLLQFPELRPEDFAPWVNVDDARRKDMDVASYAQQVAQLWRDGLRDWGIGPDRIRALQETVDYTIFTPGSDAGVPVNILGSLAAPGVDFEANAELVRDRIQGTVAALLGLVGVPGDPVRSREAILLSNIFEHFWRQNQDLDLAQMILAIQNPPVRRLGVFDVDTFFPEKERFELSLAFNNLMAAPAFQSWLQGEPLDVDRLLFTEEGKPRHSIFYLAHLSDSERMFFVTLLLESVTTWVRRQSGTTSLRALLYFDEIFGFFPPTAEPPSKRPLLTLLKQARASGLGCVLVSQNPVDIDYKGLTNAGTWFIGKLQAERDKERLLAGLKGILAEVGGRQDIDFDTLINRLDSRIFLLHNVHGDGPRVMQTRWAMSYLRGPLTRPQVRQLMEARKARSTPRSAPPPAARPAAETSAPVPAGQATGQVEAKSEAMAAVPAGFSRTPPILEPDVPQVYLPLAVGSADAVRQLTAEVARPVTLLGISLVYEPAALGVASVRFLDRKRQIDVKEEKLLLAPAGAGPVGVDWGSAEVLPLTARELLRTPGQVDPAQGPFFAPVPDSINGARELKQLARSLSDWLYYNSRLPIQVHPELEVYQMPGERQRAFLARLQQAAREARDAEVDRLEAKYATQLDRLRDKLERARREKSEKEADLAARRQHEWIGIGESILGFFLGRRSTRALSTAASRRRMTMKAGYAVEELTEEIQELEQDIQQLQEELQEQSDAITRKWANSLDQVEVEELKPRRADVEVQTVAVAWLPSWLIRYHDGLQERTAVIAAYRLPEG